MTTLSAESRLVRIPDGRAAQYRQQGWWRDERVDDLLLRHASERAGERALVAGDRVLTYGELAGAVASAGRGLRRLGIGRDDVVVVQLPNVPELVVLVLALMRVGARPVMTLPALRQHELDHVLAITGPVAMAVPRRSRRFDHLAMARELRGRHSCMRTLLVTDADEHDRDVVDLTRLCRPDGGGSDAVDGGAGAAPGDGQETALFLLSSGTTGPPKPIARAQGGYGYMLRMASELAGLSADSVYLAVMPVTHGFVLGCPGVLGTLACGGRVVLDSADDPRRALEVIAREGVTHCALVPALTMQWLAAASEGGLDLSSLSVLQVGGSKLQPSVAAQVPDVLGARVQQVYGMSEGLLNFTRLDDPDEVVRDTQGRPGAPGDEIRIVDDSDNAVAPGEMGELLTRGPYTVAGYYGDPEANRRSFTPDGFYRTGDLVRLHPSGNLVVEGRAKDAINRGGEKISVDELEAMVLQHPQVRTAAAVAMPHPLYGEAVCLYVVPSDGEADAPDLRELRRFLESRGLARYKFPERLEVVDVLPMVGVGKVNKVALREDIRARLEAER